MERIVKLIRKLWGGVTKFVKTVWCGVANIDRWILGFRWGFGIIFMTFVAIYLIFDVIGKVPEALHINLVMVSATLGGLVFAGASFISKDSEDRKLLMNVAKKFIIATFLFIIFFVFFIFIKDVDVAPFSLDFYRQDLGYAFLFWLAALGIYGGSGFFAFALVDFIISLRKIT